MSSNNNIDVRDSTEVNVETSLHIGVDSGVEGENEANVVVENVVQEVRVENVVTENVEVPDVVIGLKENVEGTHSIDDESSVPIVIFEVRGSEQDREDDDDVPLVMLQRKSKKGKEKITKEM